MIYTKLSGLTSLLVIICLWLVAFVPYFASMIDSAEREIWSWFVLGIVFPPLAWFDGLYQIIKQVF